MAGKILSTRAYIVALSPERRKGLERIRNGIRAAVPLVEDSFSYGIPGFTLKGRAFLWCAAWTQHYSIYPITPSMRKVLASASRVYETSKGTVRFDASEPLPVALIKRLAKARLTD